MQNLNIYGPIAEQEKPEESVGVDQQAVAVEQGAPENAPIHIEKTFREREEKIEEPLISEHVEIERVLKNEPVEGPLPVREEGDEIIVPVVRQILRVEKEWILTEEIHLKRQRDERLSSERVSLQEEDAHIGWRAVDRRERGLLGGRMPVFKGKLAY